MAKTATAILSCKQAEATAQILRAGYDAGSASQIFKKAVEIIYSLPELGLLPFAAGYLKGRDHSALHLVFQNNVDWMALNESISVPEDRVKPGVEATSDQIRYRFPLATEDEGLIGLAKFFTPLEAPLDDERIAIIQALLSDVAIAVAKREVDGINSHLAELAGVSPNEMYLIDADTLTIFQANRATQIKTGYRPDQILGKSSASLKEGMSEAEYRRIVQPLLDGTENYVTFEGVQKCRDGSTYEASYRVWRLEGEDGAILNEVVEDDSDHKQVLRLLQATFNSFPGGICVFDSELQLVIANHKLFELMDIPESQFHVGCNFADMLLFMAERGDYGDGDPEELVAERMSHAKLFVEHSFERTRADGVILEVSVSPLAGGGCVVTYMDVTVRRRVEMEIRRRRDMLEEAVKERTAELEDKSRQLEKALEHERQVNQLQRQFVSMASHEFRTPLTVIDGAAQRIVRRAEKHDPDFVRDKAKQIRSAVDRIVELMESILSAGKLDYGSIAVHPADCSIGDIVAACCNKRQEISANHTINLKLDKLPESIRADGSAIDQIFTNLLSNAVKYSPNAPEINVHGWQEGDNVKFTVQDHGLGVDEDDIPHMFERYFRARTASGIAGTGIGLNLIKQVIELHDGSITLESEAGKGSTFIVTLPISGPAESSTSTQEDAA